MPSTITDRLNGLTTSVAVKAPCRVATTANIALAGLQTVDGVALAARDRVLVKNQSTGSENGIWLAQASDWVRARDFDGSLDVVKGTIVLVHSGATQADSYWRVTSSDDIVIGTDAVAFAAGVVDELNGQIFSHATTYTPGTVGAKLQQSVSITDAPYSADPTGLIDAYAVIQAALAAHDAVVIPDGDYLITDRLTLRDNQTVIMSPGAHIRQATEDRQIFYANGKSGITLDLRWGLLEGEGSYYGGGDHYIAYQSYTAPAWAINTAYTAGQFRYNGSNAYLCTTSGTSAGSGGPIGTGSSITDNTVVWRYVGPRVLVEPTFWTGNGSHGDRGIDFIDCTDFRISRARIINCGHCAIALVDCERGTIDFPILEGTDAYSTPIENFTPVGLTSALRYWANFQQGIYFQHSASGNCDDIEVIGANISGVAQAVLNESVTSTQPATGLTFVSPVIHDISGQHAFYFQSGNVAISDPLLRNIELSGIKIQSTTDNDNIDISSITISGINAATLGSNMVELGVVSGTGSISAITIDGVGRNVGTGISFNGKISNVRAEIVIDSATDIGALFQGTTPQRDIDLDILLDGSGQHGIVATCTDMDDVRVRPVIRNAGNGTANQYGILCAANGARLTLYDPVISGTSAIYALGASVSGAQIFINGAADLSAGSSGIVMEAAGALIEGTYPRSFTPTITAETGSLTAPTVTYSTYTVENNVVNLSMRFTTGGSIGTGADDIIMTLPYTGKREEPGIGTFKNGSGLVKSCAVWIDDGDLTKARMGLYDATTALAISSEYLLQLRYERAA